MSFDDKDWDAILHLLAITVVADHRVRDPELVEFVHQAQRLNRLCCEDRILSRDGLKEWFDDNHLIIDQKMSGVSLDAFVISYLDRVTDKDLRVELTKAIFAICICDYEVNDEESHILKLVMNSWAISARQLQDPAMIEDVA